MNLFKRSKQPTMPGELIKDYGVINEYRKGIARFKHNVFLIEKQGKRKLIIRKSSTLIGGEVRDFEFDPQGARRLKETLDNALKRM